MVAQLGREADRAIERDPAQQLGAEVVAVALAALPDTGVRLAPVAGGALGETGEELGGQVVELAELVAQDPGSFEYLAEHVELLLVPGGVADAHRPAVAKAGEVLELVLGEVALALDAEHDLHVVAVRVRRRRARHPVKEVACLVRARADP